MKLIKLLQQIKTLHEVLPCNYLLNATLHGYDAICFFKIRMRLTWKANCYISVYDKGVKSGDEEIKKVVMDSFMNSSLTVVQVW